MLIGYIFKFICIVFIIVFIALPFRLAFRKSGKQCIGRELTLGVFILFTLTLLALALEGTYQNPVRMMQNALMRLSSGSRINLIPFHTIKSFFCPFRFDAFMVNIVGNIIMFIPWGFGLPLLWKKRQSFFSAALFSALLPLFIETVQLFIQRSVDIDDLILNFAGGMTGAALYFLIKRKCSRLDKLAR